MCFSVQVDVDIKKLAKQFNADITGGFASEHLHFTALGPAKKDKVPVVVMDREGVKIKNMLWSLTPAWAKECPVKWSTYNARMERKNKGKKEFIYEVPTFRDAFKKNQFCLLPIRGALESCYWGETAGKVVSFQKEDRENYYVIGLWEQWLDKKTGEIVETCTLLTDGPYQYFFERGHDRSVISINEESFKELIQGKMKYKETFEYIRDKRVSHEWKYEVIRDLKDGWQKKSPDWLEMEEMRETVWRKE